jgi:hypothetical protein
MTGDEGSGASQHERTGAALSAARRQPDYPETTLCHASRFGRAPVCQKANEPIVPFLYHDSYSTRTEQGARQPQAAANFLLSSSHCFVFASTTPKRRFFEHLLLPLPDHLRTMTVSPLLVLSPCMELFIVCGPRLFWFLRLRLSGASLLSLCLVLVIGSSFAPRQTSPPPTFRGSLLPPSRDCLRFLAYAL